MRLRVAALFAAAASVLAQPPQLPELRTYNLHIVDAEADTVEGAFVGLHDGRSDAGGRLRAETRAHALVVRRLGYEPKLVELESDADLTVSLNPRPLEPPIPSCAANADCLSISGGFCFRLPEGVENSEELPDEHGPTRNFRIVQHPRVYMLHQFGPNVTSGLPYVSAIEESVEWTEKSYRHIDEAAEFGVIRDAQGIRADGSRWRYFGTFMGYAGYYRIQAEHAALFDQLLDSVCIRD